MNGIDTFRELKPNKLTQRLLTYIGDAFTLFTQSTEFENVLKKKKNENQHSKAFCVFMTNHCKAKYNFQGENAQWGSHTIDIGVYKGAVLIFVIEAKLLPTPKGTKQHPRFEYEYVYGKGSGIQRFKEGKHGVDNEDIPFSDCGVIAFVKENEFDFWHKKVNQWVLDAEWETSEQLQILKMDDIAAFLSAHLREDDSKVRLHHFWVKV
ncbi:MAG: hypothetical protein R3E32_15470 [Chitinophagales bacterium]